MSNTHKLHSRIVRVLEMEFTKEFLLKNWLPLLQPVLEECSELLQEMGLGGFFPQKTKQNAARTKAELTASIALLFADLEVYDCFRENLPKETLILWDALVLNDFISFAEAKDDYHCNFLRAGSSGNYYSYYQSPDVLPSFELLPRKAFGGSYHQHENNYFYLPRGLREILIMYYEPPLWALLSPLKTLPSVGLQYSEAETSFFSDYPALLLYYQQGEIGYTGKGRPSLSGMPKVQRMTKIREFFPDSSIKRHRQLRSYMLSSVTPILAQINGNYTELRKVLLEFFTKNYLSSFAWAPALLPDIKGLNYVMNHEFTSIGRQMLELLKALPADSYVPAQHIMGYCTFSLLQVNAISRTQASEKLRFDGSPRIDIDRAINGAYYKKAIQLPLIRGTFFFFAALGLCDLVYKPIDPDSLGIDTFSAWDGLIAVRRSPLGDYICGLRDDYQPSLPKTAGFSLSEDALIIKLDHADSPYAGSLQSFAELIDPLTLRTDAGIFLQNVWSVRELLTKIDLFKKLLPATLPPNWHHFFSDLQAKAMPLQWQSDYKVFKVPEGDPELLRLIAQDPEIKSLVAKAEGYLLVVPEKNMTALRRRLAAYGYLQC